MYIMRTSTAFRSGAVDINIRHHNYVDL